MTVVDQPITWSPVNRACSSASAKHRWLDVWPGVWTAPIVHPSPATTSPWARRMSGAKARSMASSDTTSSSGSTAPCGPKASVGAPVSSRSQAASGEWSAWQWVTKMCVTCSPASAAASASRWESRTGPGSMTATRPCPIT